jgi:CheY-like chemotaxis protein
MRTKTIMVVEDELIVAEDLTRWLMSLGYTIAARAAAGREAVQRCEATRPDLYDEYPSATWMDPGSRGDPPPF